MARKFVSGLLLIALWGSTSAFAGLYENFYRGLEVLATPTGGPVFPTGDGGRANGQRNGRVRIVPHTLGRGYELQFDRTFGPDTRGRPEKFDLGPVDLTLQGAIQATAGVTTRGFPIGNVDFSANNLQYSLRGRTGAQNAEVRGTLNMANSMEVNAFGFYTMTVNVSNANSQVLLDGVVVKDTQNTNFDVGPISVEGNIFIDALAAGITSAGGDASELEGIFGTSPSDRIDQAIRDALANQGVGTTPLLTPDGQINVQAAKNSGNVLAELMSPGVLPNLTAQGTFEGAGDPNFQTTPEPGSLALLAIGALAIIRRR